MKTCIVTGAAIEESKYVNPIECNCFGDDIQYNIIKALKLSAVWQTSQLHFKYILIFQFSDSLSS